MSVVIKKQNSINTSTFSYFLNFKKFWKSVTEDEDTFILSEDKMLAVLNITVAPPQKKKKIMQSLKIE